MTNDLEDFRSKAGKSHLSLGTEIKQKHTVFVLEKLISKVTQRRQTLPSALGTEL